MTQVLDSGAFGESYPIPNSSIYPVYCFANSDSFTFKIACSTQLIFSLVALFNIIPISIVLVIEIRIQQQMGWRLPTKFAVLLLMVLVQFIVFVHYNFIFSHSQVRTFILILQNLLRNICFLLVCFLFCKNSSKLLP